jgi:hypothetical protein
VIREHIGFRNVRELPDLCNNPNQGVIRWNLTQCSVIELNILKCDLLLSSVK